MSSKRLKETAARCVPILQGDGKCTHWYEELYEELDKGMVQMQKARGKDRDDMWVDVPKDAERRHRLQTVSIF